MGQTREVDGSAELREHQRRPLRPPGQAMEGRLIDHGMKLRWGVPGQNFLPAQTCPDVLLDGLLVESWHRASRQGSCVAFRLEESWDDIGLEVTDRDRLDLAAYVGRERLRPVQGLPPRLLLALTGQGHQPITFGGIANTIEFAKVTDVAQARAALAGLKPADLGGRAEQLFGDLLDR